MRLVACVCVCGFALLGGAGCSKKPDVVHANPADVPKAPAPPPKQEEPKKNEPVAVPESKDPRQIKTVQNVRVQAANIEPRSDMKEIGLFYQTAASSGAPPTTEQAFKEEMKTAPRILELVKDSTYVLNLHGRKLRNDEILAYQREATSPAGAWVVRASGQVEQVPVDELKELLNKK